MIYGVQGGYPNIGQKVRGNLRQYGMPACGETANCIGHKSQRLSVNTWTLLYYPFLKGAMLMDNEKLDVCRYTFSAGKSIMCS